MQTNEMVYLDFLAILSWPLNVAENLTDSRELHDARRSPGQRPDGQFHHGPVGRLRRGLALGR